MPDINAQELAKAISKGLNDPTITKQVEGGDTEVIRQGEGEEEAEKPSFMPDLSGSEDEDALPSSNHNSAIDAATAIHTVAILKQELGNIDCTLKDYKIEFSINGFDINHVKIGAEDISALRSKVGDLGDVKDRHKIAHRISSLALRAIDEPFKARLKDELGLDIKAFEYEDDDQGAFSATVATEEDPIADIADGIDFDMGGMDDMGGEAELPPEEPMEPEIPGLEEPPPGPGGEVPPEMGGMPPPGAPPGPPPAAPNAQF